MDSESYLEVCVSLSLLLIISDISVQREVGGACFNILLLMWYIFYDVKGILIGHKDNLFIVKDVL